MDFYTKFICMPFQNNWQLVKMTSENEAVIFLIVSLLIVTGILAFKS